MLEWRGLRKCRKHYDELIKALTALELCPVGLLYCG